MRCLHTSLKPKPSRPHATKIHPPAAHYDTPHKLRVFFPGEMCKSQFAFACYTFGSARRERVSTENPSPGIPTKYTFIFNVGLPVPNAYINTTIHRKHANLSTLSLVHCLDDAGGMVGYSRMLIG